MMPEKLFNEVKDDIPKHIGVYVDGICSSKRAKKQKLKIDKQILKDSLIRSLYREYERIIKNKDKDLIKRKEGRIRKLEKERNEYSRKYFDLLDESVSKFGAGWWRE